MRVLALLCGLLAAVSAHGQTASLTVTHQVRDLHPGEVIVFRLVSPVALANARVVGLGREAVAVRLMSAGEAGEVWQALLGIDVEVAPGDARSLRPLR